MAGIAVINGVLALILIGASVAVARQGKPRLIELMAALFLLSLIAGVFGTGFQLDTNEHIILFIASAIWIFCGSAWGWLLSARFEVTDTVHRLLLMLVGMVGLLAVPLTIISFLFLGLAILFEPSPMMLSLVFILTLSALVGYSWNLPLLLIAGSLAGMAVMLVLSVNNPFEPWMPIMVLVPMIGAAIWRLEIAARQVVADREAADKIGRDLRRWWNVDPLHTSEDAESP